MTKKEALAALAALDAQPPAKDWREARRKREAAQEYRRVLYRTRRRRPTIAEIEALPF